MISRHALKAVRKPAMIIPSRALKSTVAFNTGGAPASSQNELKFAHPIPDFNDSKAAFESKSTSELLRAAACFRLSRIPVLVNWAETLLKTSRSILGDRITDAALKATLFGHFCAGEDQKRIQPVLKKLEAAGVGSILDYAAESDDGSSPAEMAAKTQENAPQLLTKVREYDFESEAQCDQHVETFKQCINDVASLSQDGYAAIKVTALGNPRLLARMSQAIVEAKKLFLKFDTNMDGTISREDFELGYK
jgi:proline dehydrogenase